MKITPMSASGLTLGSVSAGDTSAPPTAPHIRSLKMTTNATPETMGDPSLSISGTSEEATADEVTKPLSPQFAALAKQKRALQLERQALDREKAALAQTTTQDGRIDVARFKSDPLGVMEEVGLTYEQLLEHLTANADGSSSKVRAIEAKLKALEEGVDKKLLDRDAQQEQQVLADVRREALKLSADGDDYALIRETGSVPRVPQLVKALYDKTGEVISTREAMQLIEDELLKDNLKIAALQKVQGQLAPRPAPPPVRQMRTLTNRDTASVPMSAKQRAIAAFHGQLKR